VTTNPIFVRDALVADEASIAEHQSLAFEESSKYRGAPFQTTVKGSVVALVGGVGETVFGSIRAIVTSSTSCQIQHVFVKQSAREIGIGDALVRHLIDHCKRSGITWVTASAQPGDRAMKNLFERHGLVAQTILVGKSLSDPSIAEHASQ
jgi:GNAT superfamily N-acetyltransferase